MSLGYDADSVIKELSQPTTEITRFCFEESISKIRERPAHHMLMTLSLFSGAARREVLREVAGFGDDEIESDKALPTLLKLSLVNERSDRDDRRTRWYSLLPLTRSFVRSELAMRPDLRHTLFERMLSYYKDFLTPKDQPPIGEPYWEGLRNWRRRDEIEPEWTNISGLMRELLDLGRGEDSLNLFMLTVYLMNAWGFWNERVELGRRMLTIARESKHPAEPWIAIDAIAWVLENQERQDECIDALSSGKRAAVRLGNQEALAMAFTFETRTRLKKADTENQDQARQAIQLALGIIDLDLVLQDTNPLRRLVGSRMAVALAEIGWSERNYEASLRLYRLALDLRVSIGEMTAGVLSVLARRYTQVGDLDVAREYLSQAQGIVSRKDEAGFNLSWALLHEATGDLSESARRATIAYDLFDRIGMESGKQRAKELLRRLGVLED